MSPFVFNNTVKVSCKYWEKFTLGISEFKSYLAAQLWTTDCMKERNILGDSHLS